MDILKWEIFRSGVFKQAKFLVSAPRRAQKTVFISETGLISLELYPMSTGYISYNEAKMAWIVLHKLKVSLKGTPEPVLVISERSYVPLNPYSRSIDNIEPLKEIAKSRHGQKLAAITEAAGENAKAGFQRLVVSGGLLIIGIIIISTLIH